MLNRLQDKCALPLLSTPTYKPFWVSAEALVDKLLAYEAAEVHPNISDLIVACNRSLFREVSKEVKEKVERLRGGMQRRCSIISG